MKSIVLIFLFASAVQSASISCNYSSINGFYTCQATIDNSLGNESIPITGDHYIYHDDSDVKRVDIIGGNSRVMPSSFCEKYPKLVILDVSFNIQMLLISDSALNKCTELREIRLRNNTLSSITNTAFVYNTKLLVFELSGTFISKWKTNWLENQLQLTHFTLSNTKVSNFSSNSLHSIALESINLNKNDIKFLDLPTSGDLSNLKVLEITNNSMVGINREIFDKAVGLREVRALGNICIGQDFPNFNRAVHLSAFENCFNGFDPDNPVVIGMNSNDLVMVRKTRRISQINFRNCF